MSDSLSNLCLVVLPTVGGARDERYSGVIAFCKRGQALIFVQPVSM